MKIIIPVLITILLAGACYTWLSISYPPIHSALYTAFISIIFFTLSVHLLKRLS